MTTTMMTHRHFNSRFVYFCIAIQTVASERMAHDGFNRIISFSRKDTPSPSTQVSDEFLPATLGTSSPVPSIRMSTSNLEPFSTPIALSPSPSTPPPSMQELEPTYIPSCMHPSNAPSSGLKISSNTPSLFYRISSEPSSFSLGAASGQLPELAKTSSNPTMVPSIERIDATIIRSTSPSGNSTKVNSIDEGDIGSIADIVDGDKYPSYAPVLSLTAIVTVGIFCCALVGFTLFQCCNESSSKQENLPPVSSSASDSMLNVYPEHDSDGLPMYRTRSVNGYNSNNSFLPQFTLFGETKEQKNP
mmetsp:Transcript_22240/g.33989  ORF Transcript_22240/g.33989 Transcript_22240/m.33989 type:complete len:303 (+) Transcript_22240:1843-2751(+)